jgi:hypothetical protein
MLSQYDMGSILEHADEYIVECYTRLKPSTVDVENQAYTFSRIVNLYACKVVYKSRLRPSTVQKVLHRSPLQRRYVPHCRGWQEAHGLEAKFRT